MTKERIYKWLMDFRLEYHLLSIYCGSPTLYKQLLNRVMISVSNQAKELDSVIPQVPWERNTFWSSYQDILALMVVFL